MNLILQHWDGEPTEVERRSWESIAGYAKTVGAEHRVLSGSPMGEVSFPHMHKLYLFSERWDSFRDVVMLDSDMFAVKAPENIFDIPGIGICGPLQDVLRKSVRGRVPGLFDGRENADYYGGAIYKFSLPQRKAFRAYLTPEIVRVFDSYGRGCDEGVIHYLATRTRTVGHGIAESWACSSFSDVSKANLIHVRRRVAEGKDEKRPKAENLQRLVAAGALA